MMGYGYGFGGLFGLFMMVFWVFVIAAIVWLVLWVGRSQGWRDDRVGSARRILEERLARGEIDAEEFRARRAALEEAKR
jgi:putative membrane protein